MYADHHISPFEGGQGGCYIGTIQEERRISEGLAKKTSKYKESNIRYIIVLCCSCMLTITSPPLKGAGGMLYENDIETSNKYQSTNNQ